MKVYTAEADRIAYKMILNGPEQLRKTRKDPIEETKQL